MIAGIASATFSIARAAASILVPAGIKLDKGTKSVIMV